MPTRICCVQRLCVRVRQFFNVLPRRRGTHSHACGSSPHQTGCPGLASLSRRLHWAFPLVLIMLQIPGKRNS